MQVKTETALENHVKSHSGIRDLKCHICDAAFASRYTLNAHVKRHAITEPLFSCPYCGNFQLDSFFFFFFSISYVLLFFIQAKDQKVKPTWNNTLGFILEFGRIPVLFAMQRKFKSQMLRPYCLSC